MSSRESMSVPSRSKTTARGDVSFPMASRLPQKAVVSSRPAADSARLRPMHWSTPFAACVALGALGCGNEVFSGAAGDPDAAADATASEGGDKEAGPDASSNDAPADAPQGCDCKATW